MLKGWLAALVLSGSLLVVLPTPTTAAGTWCSTQTNILFCDDFNPGAAWTKSGNGLSACGGTGGRCYNANDWYPTTNGCGDTAARYVGVQQNGQDLGYLAPQPFGFFTGGLLLPGVIPWYTVQNSLLSPMIDATGLSVLDVSYKIRGSSEGTSMPPFDYLQVWIRPDSAPAVLLATYSGNTYQSACTSFTFATSWLSGTKFQIEFRFVQDSNTDSTYLFPCSPGACPTPITICPAVLGGCLYGGMGWYVDDVLVHRANTLPTPLFTVSLTTTCDHVHVHFTDASTDADGTVVAWLWNFGEGSPSTLSSPDHDYYVAGTFTVILQVTDNDGGINTYRFTLTIVLPDCGTMPLPPPDVPNTKPEEPVPTPPPPRDGVDPTLAGADADQDGVVDAADLCPHARDPAQGDLDADGLGDACDLDRDGDAVADAADDCADAPNPAQADRDGDGAGDACDDDADGDGVPETTGAAGIDNCPGLANPSQADADTDGIGDACEAALAQPADGAGPVAAARSADRADTLGAAAVPTDGTPWMAALTLAFLAGGALAAVAILAARRRSATAQG